ncbi:unnamed protein product [Rangifer tarandus platyrhynchus]|uniref:Uncharacterized protein n=1 Tax=Rangifer tarandus platyrhynchus TaxID=3082113 RepID=A0ABN8Y4S4_RANTA|nr:unnamed protein product [Rangifer tarandus platyrhynchus]
MPTSCSCREDRLLDKFTTVREGQGALRQTILCDYNNKSGRRHRSSREESELALPCYIIDHISHSCVHPSSPTAARGAEGSCGIALWPGERHNISRSPRGAPRPAALASAGNPRNANVRPHADLPSPSSGCVNKPLGGSVFAAEWQPLGSGSFPSFHFQRNVSCSGSQVLIQFYLSL